MSELKNQAGNEQDLSQSLHPQGNEASRLQPPSPSNSRVSGQNANQKNLYQSRIGANIPKDRLRQSKTRTIKLNNDSVGGTKLKLNDNTVTVREEKWFSNTKDNKEFLEGFDDVELENKQIKKFSINALIKEKELIKESNYFDESHDGININPTESPETVDFRMSKIEGFQTFQVKTFLFDRFLNTEIPYHKRENENS